MFLGGGHGIMRSPDKIIGIYCEQTQSPTNSREVRSDELNQSSLQSSLGKQRCRKNYLKFEAVSDS